MLELVKIEREEIKLDSNLKIDVINDRIECLHGSIIGIDCRCHIESNECPKCFIRDIFI